MAARVLTVAFEGIEAAPVEVQAQIFPGKPAFSVVGLPDKAVGESRERVRAALTALGLSLPPRRITVNLSPADLAKEGSHYDLPIALAVMAAMGVLPHDALDRYVALGELALDGAVVRVAGVLPAAIAAHAMGRGVICPAACGGEAAWAAPGDAPGGLEVLAPASLLQLVNHIRGTAALAAPVARLADDDAAPAGDLRDIKGQESAKRALEIAAAGGHNLLLVGPPGAGKSMLAARLAGLLPPLSPEEALEVSMIHSLAGTLADGRLTRRRPFRDPHHSATLAALVGGGTRARPGEISLAHHGVLFLDELPEFARGALEALRQPLEAGRVSVARANAHVTYPARFQLIAAMNPCRCGHLDDPALACARSPRCGADYLGKLSGPLLDRIDLTIEAPPVSPSDLALPPASEGSAEVAVRVAAARAAQRERLAEAWKRLEPTAEARNPFAGDALHEAGEAPEAAKPETPAAIPLAGDDGVPRCNAEASGRLLDAVATPDQPGQALLTQAAERLKLSARGWHRILKVARTLADLDGSDAVRRIHVAEALSYRRSPLRARAA